MRPSATAGERGWRAYLTAEEEEPAETLTYCPECAEREFSLRSLAAWSVDIAAALIQDQERI
jgi:hypothetical protein